VQAYLAALLALLDDMESLATHARALLEGLEMRLVDLDEIV
jgi:hypothetical protein